MSGIRATMPNALCYDNLVVLQNEIASDRVDLIYFDAGVNCKLPTMCCSAFRPAISLAEQAPNTPSLALLY